MPRCRPCRLRSSLVSLAALMLVVAGCAAKPPAATVAPAPPEPSIDQKVAWILQLEQQRVLRLPVVVEEVQPSESPAGSGASPGAVLAPAPVSRADLSLLVADADAAIRSRAALAIGRTRIAEGLPLLEKALTDADPLVRGSAAFALGLLGRSEARAALESALADPSLEVRASAIEALGLLADPAAAPAVAQAATGCAAVLSGIEPDDEEWPKSPEIEVCRQSLFALVRLGDFNALAQVALDASGRPVSRWWPVAYALQRIADPRAVPYLRSLVSSAGVYTPSFALRGLAAAKDAEAVPQAQAIAGQTAADVKLRAAAIRLLGQAGRPPAAPALVALLAEPSLPTALVFEVIGALGTIGDASTFDPLLELLTDRSPAVRAAALGAAAKVNRDAFLLVLSGLGRDADWSVRAALAGVLADIGTADVTPALESLADDDDARVHGPALAALAEVDKSAAERRALAALSAADFAERATAARVVGDLQLAGAVPALIDAYERGESDATFVARAAALGALAKYKTDEAVAALRRGLSDPAWPVRIRAAELLRELGMADAAPERPAPLRLSPEAFASDALLHPAYSPHAFIETRLGTVELQLNVVEAAVTSHAFIEQARSGFFNGMPIHRVVAGFVVQAGDPRGDGEGGPGYTLRDELSGVPFLRGTAGIALDWAETGGSQWFITLSPQPHLDAKYTVFGRVVAGEDVLDRLSPWDVIERVRIWDGVEMR
jgi:HEAT repeat protein/cyclophilin family peptidyl-prolyl cis-trans isomerase